MTSSHVGLDIRAVLKQQGGTMFGTSLARNSAPAFNPHTNSATRTRPDEISFEADVEHEARLQAVHGRRAAQRDAYLAAGAGPPTSFHQAAARGRRGSPAAPAAGGATQSASTCFHGSFAVAPGHEPPPARQPSASNKWSQPPTQTPARAPPMGRGLSREGSASAQSGDAMLNLTGMRLNQRAGDSPPSQHQSQPPSKPPSQAHQRHPAAAAAAAAAPPPPGEVSSPSRMTRAREWSAEVEDAYRLQEAGYKDEYEALALGHAPLERWPQEHGGFIKKLITRETLNTEKASSLYFSKRRECEDKDLSKVKLYAYA